MSDERPENQGPESLESWQTEISGLDEQGRIVILPDDHKVGFYGWLGWRLTRLGRFLRTYSFVFVMLVFLAVVVQAVRLLPSEELPTLIMLLVLPLGAVYGAFILGQGSRPSKIQIMAIVLLSTVFSLGIILFSQGISTSTLLLVMMVFGSGMLVFATRIIGSSDADSTVVKRPEVGDVFWGEIMNSDGEQDKSRPVIVTHVRGETVRVLYSTSQMKRARHKGFVEVSQRGWRTRGEKRSFINMRDPRVLNISQLGRRIGLMHPEDRRKIGMQ